MSNPPFRLHWPGGEILVDRCLVMGILNVTPDSFSDGGKYNTEEAAVARAWEIAEEGADILDIGAESSRPGSEEVDEVIEQSRLWPVLEALASRNYPLPISLDCRKPRLVARAFEQRFVQIVNDIEGLRNPDMVKVVRSHRVPAIIMHMHGSPRTMQNDYGYGDVVEYVKSFFAQRISETGLTGNLVVDPGIGFGKSPEHNLSILARLGEFKTLGFPVMVGVSRKSFIGKVLNLEVVGRLEGGLAATAIAVWNEASLVRTHDVRATVRAVRLAEAIRKSAKDLSHERFFAAPEQAVSKEMPVISNT